VGCRDSDGLAPRFGRVMGAWRNGRMAWSRITENRARYRAALRDSWPETTRVSQCRRVGFERERHSTFLTRGSDPCQMSVIAFVFNPRRSVGPHAMAS
jgi:hypothetical protein